MRVGNAAGQISSYNIVKLSRSGDRSTSILRRARPLALTRLSFRRPCGVIGAMSCSLASAGATDREKPDIFAQLEFRHIGLRRHCHRLRCSWGGLFRQARTDEQTK